MIIKINHEANQADLFVGLKKQSNEWYAAHILTSMYRAISYDSTLRFSHAERKALFNLAEGQPDMTALKKMFNPFDLKDGELKVPMNHYAILHPALSLLIGEITKRPIKFEINSFSKYSSLKKLNKRRELVDRLIIKTMETKIPKEQIEQELTAIKNKQITTKPAILASKLLLAYMKKYSIDNLILDTFSTALITGDPACYINKDGSYRIIEPEDIYVEYSSNSNSVLQDALSIAEIEYLSITDVIDKYGDVIDDHQSFIDNHTNNINGYNPLYDSNTLALQRSGFFTTEDYRTSGTYGYMPYADGYIRTARVTFKQFKKIKSIDYFEDNIQKTRFESEFYKVKKDKGEKEKIKYIVQYYTGLIIGDDDFYDMRAIENRTIASNGKVKNINGYVGYLQAYRNRKVTTVLSISKTLSEMYDLIVSRLIDIVSKNAGPIANMDLAKKPDIYSPMEWVHHMFRHNVKMTNSFNAAKEGIAKGMLATSISNPDQQSFELDFTNMINGYINLLQWVSLQIERLTGVSQNRLGAIHSEQLVGAIQQSITQSTLSTELIFFRHYSFISEILNTVYYTLLKLIRDNPNEIYGLGIEEIEDAVQFVNELDALADIRVTNNAREIDLCLKIDNLITSKLNSNAVSAVFAAKVLNAISSEEKLKVIEDEELRESNMRASMNEEERKKLIDEYNLKKQTDLELLSVEYANKMKMLDQESQSKMELLIKELDGKLKELEKIREKDIELAEITKRQALESTKK